MTETDPAVVAHAYFDAWTAADWTALRPTC